MTDFELKAYEKLFDSKQHYDNLSWLIGAPVLTVAIGLILYLPYLEHAEPLWQIAERLLLAAVIWLLLIGWQLIYQRNREFAEAANEAIRDLERKARVRGAGIAFMHAALTKTVVLKNTDENGNALADPSTVVMLASAIDQVIPWLANLVGLLAVIVSIFP
jgi:mannose/fructose/N-acetylgalactosamine-specific phosphotransferase system component IID